MTKVAWAVGAATAGANDTQADAGFVVPARNAAGKDAGYSDVLLIEHEIKSHLEAIALYEDEASSSDAQLRAFAQRILPQLQQHLTLLRSLKQTTGHPPRDRGEHRDVPLDRRQ
jgi:hypothetical protein